MQTINLILDILILAGLGCCVVMMRQSYYRARQIFVRLDALESAVGLNGRNASKAGS